MNIWSSSLNGLETLISLFSLKIYSDQNLYTSFWEVLVFRKKLAKSDYTIFQILPGHGGDDADKMCQGGLKRKHQMRRRVQKNRKGFYKYFCTDVMCKKTGQFSELWTDLNLKNPLPCWGKHCLSTLNISSSLKSSSPNGGDGKKTAARTYVNSQMDLRQEHISKLGKWIPSPVINKEQREWRWTFWLDSKYKNLPIHLQNDARLQFV